MERIGDRSHVFISYSREDGERVLQIAEVLAAAGVPVWVDRHRIAGGRHYGSEIAPAIRDSKLVMVMCSNASMRSRNVKQEILLAWKHGRPYLPILLEKVAFPEQLEYWLEGWQWVEVYDWAPERWLPRVLQALASSEDRFIPAMSPSNSGPSLKDLWNVARFTDSIWPVPADRVARAAASAVRGLGAPQPDLVRRHRLGSRICLAIESDSAGHLVLLDEGPEGIVYCLCPSLFAPETGLPSGLSYLPQGSSRFDSFVVTGRPGREHILAIIADESLDLGWMSTDPKVPARVLTHQDLEELAARLRALEPTRWTSLSTYFDVVS